MHALLPVTAHIALWRDEIHSRPGTMPATIRFSGCVYNVRAFAETATGTPDAPIEHDVWTRLQRAHGHVYTVRFRFTPADPAGDWTVAGIYATACGHKPDPYAPPVASNLPSFFVK